MKFQDKKSNCSNLNIFTVIDLPLLPSWTILGGKHVTEHWKIFVFNR